MAINLSTTNHVLRITTDGTEAIDVVAAYADWVSATPFTPGSKETLITTATTTTIVSAPAASTVRMVRAVSITNTSATSANIIVNVYDGTNDHEQGTFDIAADESLVYDGGKWQVVSQQVAAPSFRANIAANYTFAAANADELIDFEITGTSWDTHGWFASNTYTPLMAGKYLVGLNMLFASIADTNWAIAKIYKSGSEYSYAQSHNSGGGDQSASHLDIVEMNGSTDTLKAYARHTDTDGGAERVDAGNYTQFWAVRIGP